MTHDAVQLLLDREEIHDVVMRYADGVDRRDMTRVRDCFAPDVEVADWGGGFADRDSMITYISGVAVFEMTMHMFGNQYIAVDGDRAHVDSYAMLTHHRDDDQGVTNELNVSGARYFEDLERREGRWVITRRGGEPRWASMGAVHIDTDDPATRWLLDRAEIQDLMARYALAVDQRDYDRIGDCFASTFRAVYGRHEFTDLHDLLEFISGVEHFPSTTHFLGTQLVEVVDDDAWAQTYSLITHRPDPNDSASDWVAEGRYVDHLVRETGRWRIADRGTAAARHRTGDAAVPVSDDPGVRHLLDRAAIHDAIVSSALAMDRRDRGSRHFLNNELVDVDGDEASAETYCFVTERQADGRPSPWNHGARKWLDRLRRVDGRWVLDERRETTNRVADTMVINAAEAAARASVRSRP
ncbi:MAG TPA: nuclear transport factor 2 family protein [Acidimicrobiia bacterium]|nr:nuclear transport factor 2 family protein [Acidimicrobiia bacterium]